MPQGRFAALVGLVFLHACTAAENNEDAASSRIDASTRLDASLDAAMPDAAMSDAAMSDATSLGDVNGVDIDSATSRLDAPSITTDASFDARTSEADARLSDARTLSDATRVGFGPTQCSATRACPDSNFCTNRAPGGVCGCFAGMSACPSGTTCDVDLGACIRDCTSDLDCSAGMTCSTLSGRCALRTCDGATPCPSPYVCATGRCFRPSCAAGESCPSGWSCDGEFCVEP